MLMEAPDLGHLTFEFYLNRGSECNWVVQI